MTTLHVKTFWLVDTACTFRLIEPPYKQMSYGISNVQHLHHSLKSIIVNYYTIKFWKLSFSHYRGFGGKNNYLHLILKIVNLKKTFFFLFNFSSTKLLIWCILKLECRLKIAYTNMFLMTNSRKLKKTHTIIALPYQRRVFWPSRLTLFLVCLSCFLCRSSSWSLGPLRPITPNSLLTTLLLRLSPASNESGDCNATTKCYNDSGDRRSKR